MGTYTYGYICNELSFTAGICSFVHGSDGVPVIINTDFITLVVWLSHLDILYFYSIHV
jgi:hypothetical protein